MEAQKQFGKGDQLGVGVGAGIETGRKVKRKAIFCVGLISKESCDLYYSQNCLEQVLRQFVKK